MSELAAAVAADDSPSCPVCLEHLADQCVTLSCSHGICSSCFAELSRTAREDGHDSITCPCCRKRFRIVAPAVAPADEVDEIEDNPRALFPDDLGQFIMNEAYSDTLNRYAPLLRATRRLGRGLACVVACCTCYVLPPSRA